MLRKRLAFPHPGWYDPSVSPFSAVGPDADRTLAGAESLGYRPKKPIAQSSITEIDATSPAQPRPRLAVVEPPAPPRPAESSRPQESRPPRADHVGNASPPAAAPPSSNQPLDPEVFALKERLTREAVRTRDQDRRGLVSRLLPVLDNIDRSIVASAQTSDRGLLDGIRLVRDQFEAALADLGVQRMDALGQRFDPAVHEAVAVAEVDSQEQDGTVVDVWEAGYRMGDRVLRPARVRVGKLRVTARSTGTEIQREAPSPLFD